MSDLTNSNGMKKEVLRNVQVNTVRGNSSTSLIASAEVNGEEVTVTVSDVHYRRTAGPQYSIGEIESMLVNKYEGLQDEDEKTDHPLT